MKNLFILVALLFCFSVFAAKHDPSGVLFSGGASQIGQTVACPGSGFPTGVCTSSGIDIYTLGRHVKIHYYGITSYQGIAIDGWDGIGASWNGNQNCDLYSTINSVETICITSQLSAGHHVLQWVDYTNAGVGANSFSGYVVVEEMP